MISKSTQVSQLEELKPFQETISFFCFVKTPRISEVLGLPTVNIPIRHPLEWLPYAEVVELAKLSEVDGSEAIGAFVARKIVEYMDAGAIPALDSDSERRDDLPK